MKHECVILADVHQPMLEATRGLLDVKFNTVVMVSTFESLLEAASKIRPELIVVEISLPSADGQKLLLKLDERLQEFKIIVLGPYNEADIVSSIFEKGVDGYVLKSLTATDLLQAVDKVINGEKFISPLIATCPCQTLP